MQLPILLDIPFKYKEERVAFYPIEQELVRLASVLRNKRCKIAIFYPNESYDGVLPFSLEILYNLNVKHKEKRGSVILFGGRNTGKLRKCYLNLYYGDGSFVNNLFGMCSIGTRKLSSLKLPGIKKDAKDRFYFSSLYDIVPPMSVSEEIGCCIIIATSSQIDSRIETSVAWADVADVKDIIIFDYLPTAKKINFYKKNGFLVYGWNTDEILGSLKSIGDKETPVSSPSSLVMLKTKDKIEIIDVPGEANKYFNEIYSIIDKIRRIHKPHAFSKEATLLSECNYILRRLTTLPSPLSDYDYVASSSYWSGLVERINFILEICESKDISLGAETSELCHYIREARSFLVEKCPKFDSIISEISYCMAKNESAIVFFDSEKDINAFLHKLEKIKNAEFLPYSLKSHNIVFSTFYCSLKDLDSKSYDEAIFSCIPALSRNQIFNRVNAKAKKIVLYENERFYYSLYNSLYAQIEEKFFCPEAREKIFSFLTGKSEMPEDASFSPVTIETEKKDSGEKKPEKKDIISLLTDVENFSEAEPLLDYEEIADGGVSEKTFYVDCLAAISAGGMKIFLMPNKIIQTVTPTDEIKYKRTSELKPGDTLVLVNRGTKQTLNELILSKAEEYDKLKILKILVEIWVNELRRGMKVNGDNEASLLKKLQATGSKIKNEITISYWREGYVIGPRDPKNILRLAEIYSSEALTKNFHGIRHAVKNLRGLRRSILRRVKVAMIEGETEEIEMLGVDVSEFQQYVEFFSIADVAESKHTLISRLNKVDEIYDA